MCDQVKKELLDVNLSGLMPKLHPKHPNSVYLVKKTTEMLMTIGIPYKLFADLADSFLYSFSQVKNEDICIASLIWHFWAFSLDDHLERNPQDFSKWCDILEGKECLGDGNIEKLYQLFLKSAKTAFTNQKSLDELLRLTKGWLESFKKLQQLNGEMSEKELIATRFRDVAALPCFYFVQTDAGLEVTEELASDENWEKLTYYTIFQLIIINELCSLKKEVKAEQGESNYVYVKMKNNNISAQEAVLEILKEADNAERMARYHGEKLKESFEIDGLHTYIDGLLNTMVGNIYWSTTCKRYNQI